MAKAKLTQDMIDKGVPEDCAKCPVALLMFDAIPSAHRVSVDVEEGRPVVIVDGHEVQFTHPDKIAEFIYRFDNGKGVKPFFVEWEDW